MKFLLNLSLAAFAGVFTCQGHEVKGPVSFKEGALTFLKDFKVMDFNGHMSKEEYWIADSYFEVSGLDTPEQLPIGFDLKFLACKDMFHYDKDKISFPGKTKEEAWKMMIDVYLGHWFMFFDAIYGNDNIEPLDEQPVWARRWEFWLYDAVKDWKKICEDPHADLDDVQEAFVYVEYYWEMLLKGGKMYIICEKSGLVEEGEFRNAVNHTFAVPDVIINSIFVHFLIECHLHPGKITGPGEDVEDLSKAEVSNYKFSSTPEPFFSPAAAATHAFEKLCSSNHATPFGLTPSPLFSLSAKKQEEWAALIARSSAPKTPSHRVLIAIAGFAILALVVMMACLCSRTKKQDVARFDDLDVIINAV